MSTVELRSRTLQSSTLIGLFNEQICFFIGKESFEISVYCFCKVDLKEQQPVNLLCCITTCL